MTQGAKFTLANLLEDDELALALQGGSLAIFRLAPADYVRSSNLLLSLGKAQPFTINEQHRFHSPVHAVVGSTSKIPGEYYVCLNCSVKKCSHSLCLEQTVNPAAVNEDIDVFTRNVRHVMTLFMPRAGLHTKVAFVNVGAMLVGSVNETVQQGDVVSRGDELGFFAYGGSTCIFIVPQGVVKWDDDLLNNSRIALETKVRVGEHIGRFV